jgi:hypothetical protein
MEDIKEWFICESSKKQHIINWLIENTHYKFMASKEKPNLFFNQSRTIYNANINQVICEILDSSEPETFGDICVTFTFIIKTGAQMDEGLLGLFHRNFKPTRTSYPPTKNII